MAQYTNKKSKFEWLMKLKQKEKEMGEEKVNINKEKTEVTTDSRGKNKKKYKEKIKIPSPRVKNIPGIKRFEILKQDEQKTTKETNKTTISERESNEHSETE